MLERILFSPEKQYGLIGKLSGGENTHILSILSTFSEDSDLYDKR